MSLVCQNTIKDAIAAGEFSFAFGLTVAQSVEIVKLAKIAGYKAVCLNLEHQRTGIESAADICCTALNLGMSPIVIVPNLGNEWVSRMLDNGAQGIIVPRTNTSDMARELVRLSKHRPMGERPLAYTPQLHYEIAAGDFKQAMAYQDATTLSIPMIETLEGLENCEEIASVPGVDMIFIGAHDLSDDLGVPGDFDNAKLLDALRRICVAATYAGISVGFGGLEHRPDLLRTFRHEFPVVVFAFAGRDLTTLLKGMRQIVSVMETIS